MKRKRRNKKKSFPKGEVSRPDFPLGNFCRSRTKKTSREKKIKRGNKDALEGGEPGNGQGENTHSRTGKTRSKDFKET